MAANTYTVVWGDTLSEIALRYNTSVSNLVKLNGIKDPDFIVVGQVLRLTADAPGSTTSKSTQRPVIKVFGLQSNTDRTVYATWAWSKGNTLKYMIKWHYDTGDGVWFIGNESDTTDTQSIYNAPANAKRVRFLVRPISKTRKVNGKETTYWTAGWSTAKQYNFRDNPPAVPPVPAVSINKYKLTAELSNVTGTATHIQFQVVKNDTSVFKTGQAAIVKSSAAYLCTVDASAEYKVRCRSYRNGEYSNWSDYSANISTIPAAPYAIHTCKATSESSVYLEWNPMKGAKTYDLEYTTNKRYFDSSDKTTTVTGITTPRYEKTGLESGQEYFFRARSVNDDGESGWSEIVSVVIGKTPIAPTTWSSTTSAIVGEELILYWIHNAEDGSSQTFAEIEIKVGDVTNTFSVKNDRPEDEKDKTSSYPVETAVYTEGTKLQWRVRTAGITRTYGEWSVSRTVDIHAPATLELNLTDRNGTPIDILTSFPVYAKGNTGPNTQTPIGYQLGVVSNESYETVDEVGNVKMVTAGEEIYSIRLDTNEQLLVELSAHNLDLENNISYTLKAVSAMNSGLNAEASLEFTVSWAELEYEPNCQISVDPESLVASISPYCTNPDDVPINDVLLSVYRRNYDGSFTEIERDIDGAKTVFVTDPHPALDYARYRIVSKTKTTGTISYYDPPGYPVNEKAVVIQWDDQWSNFDTVEEGEMEQPVWAGSLLRLPYNIDVSESNNIDVEHVEYIGREHPVAYHGTQLGVVTNWNVEIPKSDLDTLYALRRLAVWRGVVYAREPSGIGYWATIKVSLSQTHREVTIPVTLSITRVEGGV